mgnify:CR=1 FL=1
MKAEKYPISRRNFIKVSAATTAAVSSMSLGSCNVEKVPAPMKRQFGKLGFEVTTLGLGGQASIQWTPDDVDPVPIILKAFEKWSYDCPKYLIGDFSFAIWNSATKELFCARDHLGVKPFNYFFDENNLIFAVYLFYK